jgi:hypothetical protein
MYFWTFLRASMYLYCCKLHIASCSSGALVIPILNPQIMSLSPYILQIESMIVLLDSFLDFSLSLLIIPQFTMLVLTGNISISDRQFESSMIYSKIYP